MDKPQPRGETPEMSPHIRSINAGPMRRAGRSLLLAAVLAVTAGCDRLQRALNKESTVVSSDLGWQVDSSLMARKPAILFRIYKDSAGTLVAPVATIGTEGFRQIVMGGRGWRAFDVEYLHAGHTLSAIRDGRPNGTITLTRGMWEGGSQLDSLEGCSRLIPAGQTASGQGVLLAMTGAQPPQRPDATVSGDVVASAMATVPTLIAPSVGIPVGTLSKYVRDVHQLNTGVARTPTLLAIYTDTVQVADSVRYITQRPKQFLVVLDKGLYGFKPTYVFSTLGTQETPPPMEWLGYLDIDRDGRAELFFGSRFDRKYPTTVALRFQTDSWTESFNQLLRCQG